MEETIELNDLEEERSLFGPRDHHRRWLHDQFQVELVSRNGSLKILGPDDRVPEALALVKRALSALRGGKDAKILERIFSAGDESDDDGAASGDDAVLARGIHPRSSGQKGYVESLRENAITIVIGPAGSGKTFLAVACAVAALRRGEYRRLVLARPAVEAGERLGFLPGDLQAKVNPYLRPLYDALFALLDPNHVQRYLESDVIEIVPLAYMRGRTLDRAFIILDEAQNATPQQMKMFLTRMGEGSKIVVTGDVTQIDLPSGSPSGLNHCRRILKGTKGIGMVELGQRDIVRHPLVQRIVSAYDREEKRLDDQKGSARPGGGGSGGGS